MGSGATNPGPVREVEEQIAETPSRERQLEEERKLLLSQKGALEEQLSQIMNSRSWRVLSAVRAILNALRRGRPYFRHKTYPMQIELRGGMTSDKDARLTLVDSEAAFELRSPHGRPSGWVRFKLKLDTAAEHMLFLLQPAENQCALGDIWLSTRSGTADLGVFQLGEGAERWLLKPTAADCPFSLKAFSITEIGSVQLLGLLVLRGFKRAGYSPALLWPKIKKSWLLFRTGGLAAIRARLFADSMSNNYQDWVRRFDLLDDSDRRKIRADIEGLQWRPKISVLMPVYNVSARWLELAIMSVRRQLYPHWELCIADDGSSNPEICAVLEKHRREDARIKVVMRGANGHISVATNSALQLATGEYVCFLDHDDELREHALYMIARALNQKADLKMLYSDEDHLTPAGLRYNPHFKSDWNPDLLLSQNYVCHLLALQSQLIKDLQGMRTGIEGAQDWDLVLRASERLSPEEIYHIPHVLYHWRVIEGSTAQSTSFKPYVLEAQQRVVREHLERTGIKHAQVLIAREISQLKVFFELPEDPPLVSVIIPTRDQVKLLRRTVDGVLKNAYRNFELLIIDNGSSERATIEYLESLKSLPNVRIIRDDGEFNFSRLNNGAVKLARGEVLGFLNNDLEPVGDAWLAELLATLCRPGIGAVGAKLLFPTGLIQHAGIILGIGGVAGHNHKGRARFETGYCNRAILRQNVSAVTAACMLIKRDIFERVGGFDAEKLAVAFNDVDLGLKIRQQGCLISFTPYAELYHYESASRGHENTPTKFMRFEKEVQVMQERWGETLLRDPYYNPNLTLESEDFRLAFPSRAVRPWKEQ